MESGARAYSGGLWGRRSRDRDQGIRERNHLKLKRLSGFGYWTEAANLPHFPYSAKWRIKLQARVSFVQGGQKTGTLCFVRHNFVKYWPISNVFHCENQENICNTTITNDPTISQVCRYTTLPVFKATIENKTSVKTILRVCRPAARRTHWTFFDNNWEKNTWFHVVNFLKCVVTKLVLFSIVAFKTLTLHKVV